MNSNSSSNHGRATIQPTARRSIHCYSHGYCPFALGEAMGRYGLEGRDLGAESSHKGTDEVDNVLSKPLRHMSPSPRRRKENERRNSYTLSDSSQEFISEDNVLSKSLPANFQSYYSDDNGNDLLEEMRHESYNSSSNSTHYRTPLSIQQGLNETETSNTSHNQSQATSSTKYTILGLCVGIIAVVLAITFGLETKTNNVIYDKITFSTDLNYLGKKYNVGDDSILKVKSGIATIIDREDTGSFIFLYNSKSSNFQHTLFNNFVNDIASTSAKLLRNDSTGVRHIVLDSSRLNMRSHNEFMNTYRDDVHNAGVMLVKELENVPSNLAMAFHYYCDEYNPLVKKSAIFFTMDLENCSTYNGQETSNAVIEKCLLKKWENVPQANILPLLTRVVGVVVDVSRIF